MSKDAHCICPKICDCQNPPSGDGIGDGPYGVSNYCPIHNDDPDPDPECPIHGYPEPAGGVWVAKVIRQVFDSDEFAVEGTSVATRLHIEELGDLVITPIVYGVYATFGFKFRAKNCDEIGQIEVPKELVEQALALARADREFKRLEAEMNSRYEDVLALTEELT